MAKARRKRRAKKQPSREEFLQKEVNRLTGVVNKFSQRNREYHIPGDNNSNTIRFGVIGDTHIGSLYERTDALAEFYKLLEKEKIKFVLHCGDILDGGKMYRGQEFELYAVGLQRQLDAVEERYPRAKGIETHFITGNHDLSFARDCDAPVGEMIEHRRLDLHHLDDEIATVKVKTKNGEVRFRLMHPSGGTAYAVSYKSQKIVEAMAGGDKPHGVFIGHYHKADHMPCFRNVQALQVGTFQSLTPYMARKPTPAHVGGWIVEDTVGKDLSSRFKTEFIGFYEPNDKVKEIRR